MLKFSYYISRHQQEGEPVNVVELSGYVQLSNWEHEHVKTLKDAAWAYVRKLLNEPGRYRCEIETSDGFEVRLINVTGVEGHIFRLDEPA